ncbi:MAG: TetR/AcrR family transcriptional regulator, cholesterol catabolism regulator [Mycobacterium sp.]|jgi:AcrR family transcriptional regulator|nr:TetR/AcrR family transcriptional regulator, cholesterol catabolism regulator [Mycobacterium sp.]
MTKSGIGARRSAALEDGGAAYVARRDEIIKAAAHVFRERGVEAATLRDIAEATDTDRATLYYYVGSKEELLQEIVREALGQDIATAQAVKRSKASSKDKIAALIESMVNGYDANYPHMHVYIEDLGRISRQHSEWSTDVIARTREYESIVHSILAKGQRDGTLRKDLPVDLCAMALFGMVNWMHRWYRPNLKWSPEEVAETFTEVFLSGLENK